MPNPGSTGARRLKRRITIRAKLTIALVVPLAGLLAVTWFEVRATSADAARVRAEAALAEASLGPTSISAAVQSERATAGVYAIGQEGQFMLQAESNADARAATDEAIRRFTASMGRDDDLRAAYRPALAALDGLDTARASVDRIGGDQRNLSNSDAATQVFDAYTSVVDAIGRAQSEVTASITDERLRGGAVLLDLSSRQSDLIARLVRNLLFPSVTGDLVITSPDEIQVLSEDLAGLDANAAQLQALGHGPYGPPAERLFAVDHIEGFPAFVREAIATGTVDVAAVGPASTGTEPHGFGYAVFRDDVAEVLAADAADVRAAAAARLRVYIASAGALTLVAALAALAVARSLSRPLHRLTMQAHAIATHRLPHAVAEVLAWSFGADVSLPAPAPVAVTTRDEIADVTVALNRVQASALELAVEQAVLRRNLADALVSLGRRNQNLVGRQIDFLTSLERDQSDPDRLAALFRLDHLATRIRRNAEALLALAGLEASRTWSSPQLLADVVRAAVGEVDDYRRVRVMPIAPARVRGSAAADVAHLLAELIENGLRATTPRGTVEVYGSARADGGYLLGVVDDGVGMTDHELGQANRRLSGDVVFAVAPSGDVGHYVVGRLAARHGASVRLLRSQGRGITALVELSSALVDLPHAGARIPAGATTGRGGQGTERQ